MYIVWGTTQAGKVDQVLDLVHVETQFAHLYYVPLIPLGSYVVPIQKRKIGFQGLGTPIGWNLKSIFIGWVRGACMVAMIAAAFVLFFSLSEAKRRGPVVAWQVPVATMIIAAGILFLSYRLKFIARASYDRAVQLAQAAQLDDVALLMIEIGYGRMNAEQADAELARRERMQADQSFPREANSMA